MSESPLAEKWTHQLGEIGGMDNALVPVPAGAVRKLISDLALVEAKLAAADKQLNPCKTCGGSGKVDDADFGDIMYNEWPCPDCASSS